MQVILEMSLESDLPPSKIPLTINTGSRTTLIKEHMVVHKSLVSTLFLVAVGFERGRLDSQSESFTWLKLFFGGGHLFVEDLGLFLRHFPGESCAKNHTKNPTRNKKNTPPKKTSPVHFLSNTFYVAIFEFPDFLVQPPSCFGKKKSDKVLSRRNRFERRYQRSRHWVPRILAFQVHKGEVDEVAPTVLVGLSIFVMVPFCFPSEEKGNNIQ